MRPTPESFTVDQQHIIGVARPTPEEFAKANRYNAIDAFGDLGCGVITKGVVEFDGKLANAADQTVGQRGDCSPFPPLDVEFQNLDHAGFSRLDEEVRQNTTWHFNATPTVSM